MEPGEIVRSVINYSSAGASEQLNVVYHVQGAASAIADELVLDAMGDYFINAWAPAWTPLADELSELEEVRMDVILPSGLIDRILGNVIVGAIGTGSVGVTAAAVSAYMLLRTAEPRSRGSKFVPGLSENIVLNGILTPAGIVALTVLGLRWEQNIDVDVVLNAMRPGLVSRAAELFREFTGSGFAEDVPAYIRGRKPNVGS